MKDTVERVFSNLKFTCAGWSYQNYDNVLKDLLYAMRDRIGHPFIDDDYHNLRFIMNIPLYREFSSACQMKCHDSDMYRGVKMFPDPTLRMCDSQSPIGIVRLIYEAYEAPDSYLTCIKKATYDFWTYPHIDHVIFNGPATIVFWKDGTKTVVKHDGKGRKDKRQAVLYAFIRKIYGEGRPYNNILNEIEEAVK